MSNSNVVQFPTAMKRGWGTIQEFFKNQVLNNTSASESRIDDFLQHFKPIYESFDFGYEFTFENISEDTHEQLKSECSRFMIAFEEYKKKLIMERLMLEVGLFNW